MAEPLYDYIPIFGVEPFKEIPGKLGGAELTNDNLIITNWEVSAEGGAPPNILTLGDIFIPLNFKDSALEALKPLFEQAMHSRVAARFGLDPGADKADYPFVLSACVPPQELKQQLANSVIFNGGDPDVITNYTALKSAQGLFTWKTFQADSDGSQNTWDLLSDRLLTVSTYIPVLALNGLSGSNPLALLRTNGADGEKPEFFDMTTAAGVQECIVAVNKGEFFVALMTSISPGAGSYLTTDLIWPGSTTRG